MLLPHTTTNLASPPQLKSSVAITQSKTKRRENVTCYLCCRSSLHLCFLIGFSCRHHDSEQWWHGHNHGGTTQTQNSDTISQNLNSVWDQILWYAGSSVLIVVSLSLVLHYHHCCLFLWVATNQDSHCYCNPWWRWRKSHRVIMSSSTMSHTAIDFLWYYSSLGMNVTRKWRT